MLITDVNASLSSALPSAYELCHTEELRFPFSHHAPYFLKSAMCLAVIDGIEPQRRVVIDGVE